MARVKIFVEGKADRKFLQDYLRGIFNVKFADNDFILIEGNSDSLIELKKNEFLSNTDMGGINLVILDSDKDNSGTRKRLEDIRKRMNVFFEIFLLPSDDSPGELEDLLLDIINTKNAGIFTCFDEYLKCLERKPLGYKVPSNKAKIYAYLDAMAHTREEEKKVKEEFRNYINADHWRLNHAALNPLKDFLLKYIHE
jgi:hypothetical protein